MLLLTEQLWSHFNRIDRTSGRRHMNVTLGRSANCPSRCTPCGFLCLLLVALSAICPRLPAQTTPAIVGISPASVSAGNPSFTLTVTGSGFQANSVVQINGSNRPTVFKSALQLTATVFASDIATPSTLQVTVFNPFATGGGLTSNPAQLTVSTASSPSLISVSPGFTVQGADHLRMTLVGANFRPGATVVVSPPLAAVIDSNGHTRAGDVAVLGATVVNSGLMTAILSLSPRATLGLRAVDVLNLDGTSTAVLINGAGGTSQPIEVQSSNSLGAPLSVLNMALTHPRDGTVVMQGQELNAEAILAGTGTGTVIGQWLWDGNVVEQFSAAIVGGQSTTIQTRQSLPTWYLGAHTLLLRMVQPNQVASLPIVVVVNPGDWNSSKLFSQSTARHLHRKIRRDCCGRRFLERRSIRWDSQASHIFRPSTHGSTWWTIAGRYLHGFGKAWRRANSIGRCGRSKLPEKCGSRCRCEPSTTCRKVV